MKKEKAIAQAGIIPTWLEQDEREALFDLAGEVPAGGQIVEVGCLYGGSTALLGLGAPTAKITIFDDFSWSPLPDMPAGPKTLGANLEKAGVKNDVTIMPGDSRVMAQGWDAPIDLLWIDGGHSYDFIFSDLTNLGPHAQVIACHDYDNPAWPSIRHAVEEFIQLHPVWAVAGVAGTVVVLRKVQQ
jgi:predicted O-methyltransferase YrrM